ncbi:FAM173 family [Plasmopara halstedii]|uniref:FAM173 family n=1 Tax=Plasmopara halstedii TaxID=4781 RepID=A0A0P1A5E4_PLAHL|nr:FAM173 family [Plasmopara halstedii]CEG35737.1 FAM173 family [Plasmopara halstedii]|eukprot:XP_024572106.1 FAM173 family [Plasmopara halstedii]
MHRDRRHIRQLILQAARIRATDVLTPKHGECNHEIFAPFSPSPIALIDAVWNKIELSHTLLRSDDLLVDLGCGDGRWLISGVQRFHCSAFGVEIDENLVKKAKEQIQQKDLSHKIHVELGDIMQVDISQAKLVIIYAFAESLKGIAERLRQQLKTDANVLSIGFRILQWKPYWSERNNGLRWYLYRIRDCQ